MTAAASGSTAATDAGPRPRLLTVAAILLGVSAVLGFLLPLSQLTDKQYLGCSIAVGSANASASASPSVTVTPPGSSAPTVIARETATDKLRQQFDDCRAGSGVIGPAENASGEATGTLLLQGIIPLVIFGGLGFFAFRGVPLVRWFTVGAWVIGGFLGIISFGPLQLVSAVQADYPTLTKIIIIVGSVVFTAAVVLVNLPVVTKYFNARRPVRTAPARAGGGGLGGLFGPRPPRGGAPSGPTSSSSSSSTVSMDKPAAPAASRPPNNKGKGPSGGSGNTGRAKGKKRG